MNLQECRKILVRPTNRLGFALIDPGDTVAIRYTYQEVCGDVAENKPSVKDYLRFANPDFTLVVSSKRGEISFIRTGIKLSDSTIITR